MSRATQISLDIALPHPNNLLLFSPSMHIGLICDFLEFLTRMFLLWTLSRSLVLAWVQSPPHQSIYIFLCVESRWTFCVVSWNFLDCLWACTMTCHSYDDRTNMSSGTSIILWESITIVNDCKSQGWKKVSTHIFQKLTFNDSLASWWFIGVVDRQWYKLVQRWCVKCIHLSLVKWIKQFIDIGFCCS